MVALVSLGPAAMSSGYATSARIRPVSGRPEHFNAADFFVDRHLAEGRGGRTAFRFRGRSLTYAALAELAGRAASALAGLGVEIENRVVLALSDSPAFAAVFWGAAKLGAVSVPIPPQLGPAEQAFVLNDSRARVAVVDATVASGLASVRADCPWLRAVVVADGPAPSGMLALDDVLARGSPHVTTARTFREDILYWGYTSGSTGRPKAAVHAHQDFLAAAELVGVGIFELGQGDLVFSASKMFFAFGLGNSLYFPAFVGGAAVLVPERIDAERAFATIAVERATVFFAVPTLFARMLEVPDAERRWDLSSLRYCVSSGEALPPPLFDAWRERFGHELVEVVGSTEALHDFIANRPGQARRGSGGRLVPGFEARLVDDAGAPVAPGVVGHLLIRGDTTAPYYWNRRERTRATMLGEWLRTGDMFSQDADGFFYFAGRDDDMLKVAGMWVSPAEVEAYLMAHPAVLEAGVVGRGDGAGLVRPHAFVALKSGYAPSAVLGEELGRFVRGRAAAYKAPAWIDFVDELPKTATGKVQRFRLRALARDGGVTPGP
jgi:benzoate-CoA ligase